MGKYEAHSTEENVELVFGTDDDATVHFTLPAWTMFVAVIVPDLADNANVGLEVSDDDGVTYYPVLNPSDGQDLVICDDTPSDPGYVSISQFIDGFMAEGQDTPTRFRFTMDAAQSADRTFKLFVRG